MAEAQSQIQTVQTEAQEAQEAQRKRRFEEKRQRRQKERELVNMERKFFEDLAHVGMAVELSGHDLNDTLGRFQSLMIGHKRGLPEGHDCAHLEQAMTTIRELTQHLLFVTEMRVSGAHTRTKIYGRDVEAFLKGTNRVLRVQPKNPKNGFTFEVTGAFRWWSVCGYKHRILPVFSNLIHNAISWLHKTKGTREEPRKILLDRKGNRIFICDNGPGVAEEDVPQLFEPFFTRRHGTGGRGIGLYLCKKNLAESGHTIRYAQTDEERLLPGANFIIEFREDWVTG